MAKTLPVPTNDVLPVASRRRKLFRPGEALKHAIILVLCLMMIYPFVLMLQLSIKDVGQIIYEFFQIKAPFHFENYTRAWGHVNPLILNSFIMAIGSSVGAVLLAVAAGYGFGRLHFPGKEFLFWILFLNLLLPNVLNLIPAFVLAMNLKLLDTYWAVILFAISSAQPFWVFVMRTFVSSQPKELFEAASMDGCTHFQNFRYIALPLLKPMIALMGIQIFITVWNDYIWPLVTIQSPGLRPITVGLAYLTSSYPGDYGPLMAGYALASIPLIVLFMLGMRQFVEGITSGSLKL